MKFGGKCINDPKTEMKKINTLDDDDKVEYRNVGQSKILLKPSAVNAPSQLRDTYGQSWLVRSTLSRSHFFH